MQLHDLLEIRYHVKDGSTGTPSVLDKLGAEKLTID